MKDVRDVFEKAVSLGLGFAITSKEQVEKVVDEWVKKGELSKTESKDYVNELLQKGNEAREKVEAIIRERVQTALSEQPFAMKADIERLERRLEQLEQRETSDH